jgi:hypothetical protein
MNHTHFWLEIAGLIIFYAEDELYIASLSFQDSQNDTFLPQAGVYLLVPKDL